MNEYVDGSISSVEGKKWLGLFCLVMVRYVKWVLEELISSTSQGIARRRGCARDSDV